ncbi:uncharacterized protein [Linepithema humile]|uniref:uncharacterized protein n=1 Tax=Linepithema humile TaxID=83485 RepID=UPI00351EADFF
MSEINNETAISTKSHDYRKDIESASSMLDEKNSKNTETSVMSSETDYQKKMTVFTSTRNMNETDTCDDSSMNEKIDNSKEQCNSKSHIDITISYGNTNAIITCDNISEIINATPVSTNNHDYEKNFKSIFLLSDERSSKTETNAETNVIFSETDCQKEKTVFTSANLNTITNLHNVNVMENVNTENIEDCKELSSTWKRREYTCNSGILT